MQSAEAQQNGPCTPADGHTTTVGPVQLLLDHRLAHIDRRHLGQVRNAHSAAGRWSSKPPEAINLQILVWLTAAWVALGMRGARRGRARVSSFPL